MDKLILMTHIKNAVDNMSKTKSNCTYHWYLGTDNDDNDWCIVLGWCDGFDSNEIDSYSDDTYRLCIKLAYQPSNSLLQCDYNIDWLMPYDEKTNDVDDTEIPIYKDTNLNIEIDWLLNKFKEYELNW